MFVYINNLNIIIYQMSRQARTASQGMPKFRSTKYNTLYKKNQSNFQLQESKYQNLQQNKIVTAQKFRKLAVFTSKRKSIPFTTQIILNSNDAYLQTFNSFMSRTHGKENRPNHDLDVVLTHYKSQFDQNQSNFTLLDLLVKPFSFVQGESSSLKKQLASQTFKRQMLRAQLKELQFRINKQIEDIERQTGNRLNQFRKMLKNSEIAENQRKLRNKKELKLIEKGHLLNKSKLESLKDRNLEMQSLIFDCQPLQLDFLQHNSFQLIEEQYL